LLAGPSYTNWTNSSQMEPEFKGLRAGVIYSLFKYTQQHIVGFTENNIELRTF
jgi:hypothetical protein